MYQKCINFTINYMNQNNIINSSINMDISDEQYAAVHLPRRGRRADSRRAHRPERLRRTGPGERRVADAPE